MSPVVLSFSVCFVSLVYGKYQSEYFMYKGQVQFTNKQSTVKEVFIPSDVNGLIYCGLQCVREPRCLAIEMCSRGYQQLCRLCNSTNPSFTENETDSCSHLQLDTPREKTCVTGGAGENNDNTWSSVFNTCKDILKNSHSDCGMSSGVYSINIDGKPTDVWCDMKTDGGGWTVIQRRQSGITDFDRSWYDYKKGFGNVSDEYWIGNDALHILTSTRNVTLRVDLEQFSGIKGYGTWNSFQVDNEAGKYRLSLSGGFKGASEINYCFHHNNGQNFSTKDRDNDSWGANCAVVHHYGGWWYGECTNANLNGRYHTSAIVSGKSVSCYHWTGYARKSLKTSTMMIR